MSNLQEITKNKRNIWDNKNKDNFQLEFILKMNSKLNLKEFVTGTTFSGDISTLVKKHIW